MVGDELQRSSFDVRSHADVLTHGRRFVVTSQVDDRLAFRPDDMNMHGQVVIRVYPDCESALSQHRRHCENITQALRFVDDYFAE